MLANQKMLSKSCWPIFRTRKCIFWQLSVSVILSLTGKVSAEERYGACVCYEDIAQSRYAGERTGELLPFLLCFVENFHISVSVVFILI